MTGPAIEQREIYGQYETLVAFDMTYSWPQPPPSDELTIGTANGSDTQIGLRYILPATNPADENVIVCDKPEYLVEIINEVKSSPVLWLAEEDNRRILVLIEDAALLSRLSIARAADNVDAELELTPHKRYDLNEIGPMLSDHENVECHLRLWLESTTSLLRFPYDVDQVIKVNSPQEAMEIFPTLILCVSSRGDSEFMIFVLIAGPESKGLDMAVDCESIRRTPVKDSRGKIIRFILKKIKRC